MANDITQLLTKTLQDALSGGEEEKPKGGGTAKGLLAGAALAAAAPLAKRGLDAARSGELEDFVSKLGTGQALEDVRSRLNGDKRDDEKPDAEEPEGEEDEQPQAEGGDDEQDDDDDEREPSGGPQATGKGRRMPIQQSVDVGVPVQTAYNQFTQFEDWPKFMHRVTRVTQEDECEISFATKIWGKTKEFKADIVTQRPDERIKWRVSQGITHTGVITFHELAPNLTRIELTMDVDPGSLIEKAARGMRHIKRSVRADLHRYKAFIEMQEIETGAWRGEIKDGELVEEHDPEYDEEREYSDIEAASEDDSDEPEAEADAEDEGDDADEPSDQEDEDVKPQRRRQGRARKRTPAPA